VTSVLVVGAVITAALTAITRGTLPEPVASTGYALVLMAVGALILIGRRPTAVAVAV
jgi:hypothetical protein